MAKSPKKLTKDQDEFGWMVLNAADGIHVIPTYGIRPHDLHRSCWCEPKITFGCPECSPVKPDENCWRCDGEGMISDVVHSLAKISHYTEAEIYKYNE